MKVDMDGWSPFDVTDTTEFSQGFLFVVYFFIG